VYCKHTIETWRQTGHNSDSKIHQATCKIQYLSNNTKLFKTYHKVYIISISMHFIKYIYFSPNLKGMQGPYTTSCYQYGGLTPRNETNLDYVTLEE
jgi:hypothetical protein